MRKSVVDKEIYTKKDLENLLEKLPYSAWVKEIDYEHIIRNVEKDMIFSLKASGISIWLLDESKDELSLFSKIGIAKYTLNDFHCYISLKGAIEAELDNNFVDGISLLEKRKSFKDCRLYNEYKYLGLYKIEYKDRLLGILTCSFKDDSLINGSKDELIRDMCNEIAIILKRKYVSEEITEEYQKHRNNENELSLLLETVVDIILTIDKNGLITKVNEGALKILGWSYEEILNKQYTDYIYKDDIKVINDSAEMIDENGVLRGVRVRVKCKDSNYKWLEWNCRVIKNSGSKLVAIKDISNIIEMENQQCELEKVVKSEVVKNEFFANISHEFKTPINIILSSIQLINNNIKNNNIVASGNLKLSSYTKSIKQNSYRLLRLVNNLIDMTRIDTGYYELTLENHNIVSVIEEITLSVAEYMASKKKELVFDTEVEELILACDPDKIERIMLNLLSNAIKFTPEEGKIRVNLKINEREVEICVSDNGVGISKEKLAVIFERFVQEDNILTRNLEGSGIGLSLVKSLVDLHGGKINVSSELEVGTTFNFTLPIRLTDNTINVSKNTINSKVEKCSIEFSDIYY